MRAAGVETCRVRVIDLRYLPGRRCVLQYGVRAGDNEAAERIYVGSMDPVEGAARGQARTPDRSQSPAAILPSLGLSLYAFPSDPDLPAACQAMDVAAVSEALTATTGRRLPLTSARVLAYRPGLRVTVGYHTTEGLSLIGKVTRPRRAQRLAADAERLALADAAGVRLLMPMATLPSWPMLMYPRIDGCSLAQELAQGTNPSSASALAAALAALHAMQVPTQRERRPTDEADRVREHAEIVATLRPPAAPQVRRLGERLAAAIAAASTELVTVHGDFHDENVLFGSDGITLIDLEEAARGNPAIDVARLLGALRKRAVLEPALAAAAGPFAQAFQEAYEQHRACDRVLVAAHEAGFLLKSAVHCFETQRPQWPTDIDNLLAEAERTAECLP